MNRGDSARIRTRMDCIVTRVTLASPGARTNRWPPHPEWPLKPRIQVVVLLFEENYNRPARGPTARLAVRLPA